MEKSEKNPQKRDKSLVPLSREHHFSLLFCWKLRQGLKNGTGPEVMRGYVRYFWENNLKEHFEEEEWLLKRLLPASDALYIRIMEEHRLLREIIHLVNTGDRQINELLQTLQQDLNDHIRWEERELFPYMQAAANSDDLELAGKLLEHRHTVRTDDFTPEFWVNRKN
ncbi:hemerythrin domain-containing protein [Pontibacter sp. 172403-2]|uniref:hemerythrin domain-containing protein n=1 Tax=Pontibacter rufus TaxID=2791028 RepID=UPI0018AF6A2C|nr:hemerythrin domain-containing protein [Pontibacter sp. 172403-2]MBF9254127.1 hemerythrin domain-containing protein [Pontibacter sp. 172403-2]